MSNFQLIVDVIFATYLVHFLSGFLNSFLGDSKARVWADVILGIVLLFLVLSFD
jgi:hypothetical protein